MDIRYRAKLLVIEDEPFLAQKIKDLFKADRQTTFEVRLAEDGNAGLALSLRWKPDVVVLDLNLPGLDGLSVLRRIHQQLKNTRVCIVSAIGNLRTKLQGFQDGTDDYLVKPFAAEELRARVVALLRRGKLADQAILMYRDLWLDLSGGQVRRGDQRISLTKKEFQLLAYLMRRPDQVISRNELLDQVWEGKDLFPNTVDAHIEKLRQKIDRPFNSRFIQTAYGQGYYFDTHVV